MITAFPQSFSGLFYRICINNDKGTQETKSLLWPASWSYLELVRAISSLTDQAEQGAAAGGVSLVHGGSEVFEVDVLDGAETRRQ